MADLVTEAVDRLRTAGVKLNRGLSDRELARIEKSLGFTFGPSIVNCSRRRSRPARLGPIGVRRPPMNLGLALTGLPTASSSTCTTTASGRPRGPNVPEIPPSLRGTHGSSWTGFLDSYRSTGTGTWLLTPPTSRARCSRSTRRMSSTTATTCSTTSRMSSACHSYIRRQIGNACRSGPTDHAHLNLPRPAH